ncbi:Fe-S cluster assembly sulfur transfer protein SufU [Nitrospirillum viridazoti]|uniref:SUF system NifU family Fe-S cluster assembly protein n=1 Tax=Nitrospirillum viridazoti CBAmc TaxID=1441467 RepID=A0A248JMZ1_9PROT|nr:SUF system NifU family Fe-S cluster assembly protein [Nitrospirillum amazonense]ASG19999.1 SUF system NifU family Fe-S cluster assembly protein [Nitrospirillum amazonense CBAmc]TWB36312.1 nitrogen fixation NifU-like protein [Nitrospirillum amazonense]
MFDDLRDLYQEVILDHGKHPRNFGKPEAFNRMARGENPLCGDKINVYLSIGPEGVVNDAHFDGRGCAISQASASLMTETLKGKTEAEAEALFGHFHDMCTKDDHEHTDHGHLDPEAVEKLDVLSGVREFPMRVKCATLAWHTMHAAIHGDEKTTTE